MWKVGGKSKIKPTRDMRAGLERKKPALRTEGEEAVIKEKVVNSSARRARRPRRGEQGGPKGRRPAAIVNI